MLSRSEVDCLDQYNLKRQHYKEGIGSIGARLDADLCDERHTTLHEKKWTHPGGKLRELGAAALDDSELLAILISSGTKGRSAPVIAQDLMSRFGSLTGLANQPLERLLEIRGLGDVKILRIAAALELARRTAKRIIREREKQTQ